MTSQPHQSNTKAMLEKGNIDGMEGKIIAQSGANNNKKSRNSNKEISQESDSFYKYYNKEIKVNQEEIPIVLYELIDAAYNYIQRESYDKALILLQKTEGVLEVVSLESSKRDKYIAYTCFHNMAMCYQKLNMLEECYIYLKECHGIISQGGKSFMFYKFSNQNYVAARMKQLKQECKLRLQLCAILSQTQNHTEALDNAKKSCKLVHQLFKDLLTLCALYMRKIEKKEILKKVKSDCQIGGKSITDEDEEEMLEKLKEGKSSEFDFTGDGDGQSSTTNFLEESISMLERTSMKLYPVVKEVLKRMIDETPSQKAASQEPTDYDISKLLSQDDSQSFLIPQGAIDMRSVLGFLNQNEWVYSLNIGNIMQLQPVHLRNDLLQQCRNECELSRDSFLEKIALMSVAYFCVSTEMRFILQSREQYLSSPVKRTRELESEYWHAKSLEIACSFLPSECPLLNHILLSYQKHHDPSLQPIKEEQEQTDVLSVIRPLPGIESNKYQPIVRQITNLKVALTPCQISPITKRVLKQGKKSLPQRVEIDVQDQQEKINEYINKEMQTSMEINEQLKQGSLQQLQPILPQVSMYSDDYYDQFVKKIFDDNPLLDKKTLVSKLLSHLQSQQDFSYLQRQINEQALLDDEEDFMDDPDAALILANDSEVLGQKRLQREFEKEQRRTLMHFGQGDENDSQMSSPHSELDREMKHQDISDDMVDMEDIILKEGRMYSKEERQGIRTVTDNSKQSFSKKGGMQHMWSQQNQVQITSSGNEIRMKKSQSSSGDSSSKFSQMKVSQDNLKKKRDSSRVKKLMSCLEGGDSLLKEIERSLEQHKNQQQEALIDNDEDEFINMLKNHQEAQGQKLQALNIDSEDEEEDQNDNPEEAIQIAKRREIMEKFREQQRAQDQIIAKPIQTKLSNSKQRPSSSISNHTSTIGTGQQNLRKSSHPIATKKKVNNSRIQQAQSHHHQFASQQHPLHFGRGRSSEEEQSQISSCSGSPRAQSEEKSAAITSITVNPQLASEGSHLRRKMKPNVIQDKLKAKNLNKVLASTTGVHQQSATKQQRRHSNTSKKQRYGTQPHQSVGTRVGGAPRSKSRLSNQSNQQHFKSMKEQVHTHQTNSSQPRQGKKSVEKKRTQTKSKSSEEGRSSSIKQRNVNQKKRDHSAESAQLIRKDNESITPGGRCSQVPLLTQPSFSEHTNTGSKNNFPHNYSFDVSNLNQRSRAKNSRDHSSSITSLQQQVLFNQKVLLQFQQQQMQSRAQAIGGTMKQPSRKSQTRPQTALGKQSNVELQNLIQQQSVVSMDTTKKSTTTLSRGKSATGQKKSTIASLSNTNFNGTNPKKFVSNHHQSIDQSQLSRQAVVQGLISMLPQGQSFNSFSKGANNKENQALLSKASNILSAQQINAAKKQAGGNSQASAAKKKTIKDFANGVITQQKSVSRDQIGQNYHTNVGRSKFDNHFTKSFFDQNSPQLQKKQKQKTTSHSPPKKIIQTSSSINKLSQKATSDLRNFASGMSNNSRQATAHMNNLLQHPVFVTHQDALQPRVQRPKSALATHGVKKRQKQLQTSIMNFAPDCGLNPTQLDDMHNQSWFIDNNQSFDSEIKGSGDHQQQILGRMLSNQSQPVMYQQQPPFTQNNKHRVGNSSLAQPIIGQINQMIVGANNHRAQASLPIALQQQLMKNQSRTGSRIDTQNSAHASRKIGSQLRA